MDNIYTKIIIGACFGIISGLYIYYAFKEDHYKYSKYIDDYLEVIHDMLKKTNGEFTEQILCHLNYIKNEIIQKIIIKSKNTIDLQRINSFKNPNKELYELKLKETDNIKIGYLSEAERYIKKNIDSFDDIKIKNKYITLTDNLINLPENKSFAKLLRYSDNEIPNITDKVIDDSFFYTSTKQIEYDKILEKFNEKNSIDVLNELIIFKQKFKDEFYIRYNYNCKYLSDLVIKKEGEKAENLNLLINKITY